MSYCVRPLPFKPPHLNGLSEKLLVSHYENNYGGAVRRLNAIDAELGRLDWDKAAVFAINGLKREQLIAANSMILHEAYFDALGGSGDPAGALAQAMERDFGSVANWRREFIAMGKAMGGGSGWVLLTWSARLGRLVNQWAADHTHSLGDGAVILALDMYEHAYHMDFGTRAAAYVDAFMQNIAWDRIGERYQRAIAGSIARPQASPEEITPESLRDLLSARSDVVVLDVRLEEDLAKGSDLLPAALWRRPQEVETWSRDLPRDRPVVAYCVYGFHISRDAVTAMRAMGIDARSLSGGIAAWHAIGAATVPKPD
ncbi:MAG: Fe-Mn family superoxide dismutase [Ferrovibrio sp.]